MGVTTPGDSSEEGPLEEADGIRPAGETSGAAKWDSKFTVEENVARVLDAGLGLQNDAEPWHPGQGEPPSGLRHIGTFAC